MLRSSAPRWLHLHRRSSMLLSFSPEVLSFFLQFFSVWLSTTVQIGESRSPFWKSRCRFLLLDFALCLGVEGQSCSKHGEECSESVLPRFPRVCSKWCVACRASPSEEAKEKERRRLAL